MFSCKFCKKEYQTISSLNNHIKTAKFCLKIQEDLSINNTNTIKSIKNNHTCTFCNKIFNTKVHLETHIKSCKSRKEYIDNKSQEETFILKNNNKILTDQLTKTKEDYKNSTNILKEDYKNSTNILKNDIKNLEDQLSRLRVDYDKIVTINAQAKNNIKVDNSYNINFNEAFEKLPQFNKANILKALKENISPSSIKSEDYFLSGVVTEPTRGKSYIKNEEGNKEKTHTEKIVRSTLGIYKEEGHRLCEDNRSKIPDNELYTPENLKISGDMGMIQAYLNTSDSDRINHLTVKGGNMLNRDGILITTDV